MKKHFKLLLPKGKQKEGCQTPENSPKKHHNPKKNIVMKKSNTDPDINLYDERYFDSYLLV